MHIGIIGAGHAGIEAALTARQAGAEVTVFSAEPVLPYFRPRLVAVAMGQAEPGGIAMQPASWYEERGIHLRLATPVAALDAAGRMLTAGGATEHFDAIVMACGALPRRPRFGGETSATPIFTLWSLSDAVTVRQRVRAGMRLVVIGGASLGIELALRAREQGMHAQIVERLPRLMPLLLGEKAADVLQRQLEAKGIVIRTGHPVASFAETGDGAGGVRLNDGAELAADVVMVCVGALPNLTLAHQAGLATARGICTDACLQAVPGIFVAGDVCQAEGRPARGVVREASAQGRLAGANAVAYVKGGALQAFTPAVIPMTVRCAGVEINVAGQTSGEGVCEERMDDGSQGHIFRAVTRHANGMLAGVQMIGTREGFDDLVAQITALPSGGC